MKWNGKAWGGWVALVCVLAGCASTAHVKKDESVDFRQYRKFAWIDKDGEGMKDRNHSDDLTEKQIRDAVSRELEKSAGWKESKKDPDVLLTYDVLVERSSKQQSDPVYTLPYTRTFYNPFSRRLISVYYPSQLMGYNDYRVPTREGTITISMIDARSEKTVWQGWTTGEVNSRNLSNKEIQNSVRAIFRKFDIAKN